MKNQLALSLFVIFSLLSISCKKEIGESLSNSTDNFKSGNCGSNVISDYNSIVTEHNLARTNAQVAESNRLVDVFQSKYRGINCKATIGFGLKKREITITNALVAGMKL